MPAKAKKSAPPKIELPIITARSAAEWERWLKKNHTKSPGVWLRYFKKGSCVKTVVYAEALDGALCHGWIDGQAKPYDADSWLQKFTPRRAKSLWSRNNTRHVERLIESGKMTPPGLAVVALAKADGRWDAAYDSPKNTAMPQDFLKQLASDKRAKAFFETLNKANRYAIAWRLQTAKKPETRERRMEVILEMLAKGEKFHG
jgi:uncharacterized protein YdeI (YjbR/CyaY-like superfamily)